MAIQITEPDSMDAGFQNTHNSCFTGTDGTSTVTVSGGVTPYSYSWSSGSTNNTASGMPTGINTVTVTDSNSCTKVFSTQIFSPPQIFITIDSIADVTCEGDSNGTIEAFVTGGVLPHQVLWDDPAAQQTQTASNLPEGVYVMLVEDDNGCTMTAAATVGHQHSTPVINLGGSANAGGSNSYTITAPGGFSAYQWSTGFTGQSVIVYSSGTYSVTVTDENGCQGADAIAIDNLWPTGTEERSLDASINVFPNPSNGTFSLSISELRGSSLTVNVYNAAGQVALNHSFERLSGSFTTNLDMNPWPGGIYLLEVRTNREVSRKMLIVN